MDPEARVPANHPSRAVRALTNATVAEMSSDFEALHSRTGRPGMEASHPHLTTQRTPYVEINRARDRAELVTDDRNALRERLEAATGERIAALEEVEPERTKVPEAGPDARHDRERDGRAAEAREWVPEPEKTREPRGIEMET